MGDTDDELYIADAGSIVTCVGGNGNGTIMPNYAIASAVSGGSVNVTDERIQELEDRILQLEKKILSLQLKDID